MTGRYKLPDLPYDYKALEPVISGQIMELHHLKHHQTYVNNLNLALEKYEKAEQQGDLETALGLLPAIQFNGGGHLNHSIFWETLAPIGRGGGSLPEGELKQAIEADFGSFDRCMEMLSQTALGIQGSGWAWLCWDRSIKRLVITSRANQDPITAVLHPLFGIDVWEHAYYLQYKNVRADYIAQLHQIIHWGNVQKRFLNGKK